MEILLSISSKNDGEVRELKRDIGSGLVVGRGAEEGVLLEGRDLSREHFVFNEDASVVYITDLSVNGTWLNGSQLKKSKKTRVQPDDTIEIPGYAISFRLLQQAEVNPPALLSQPAQFAHEQSPPVALQKKGALAVLDPVFGFVASFTFMEKAMFIVAICGLLLLYTYISS